MGGMLLTVVAALGLGNGTANAEPHRIGRLVISGNVQTQDRHILQVLNKAGLYPGVRLPSEAALLQVEIDLLLRFHKRFDPTAKKRPTLKVLRHQDGSTFHDIEVQFPERSPKK